MYGELTDADIITKVFNDSKQPVSDASGDEDDYSLLAQERSIPSAAEPSNHIQELR